MSRAARRRWLLQHHPDHGGDHDAFVTAMAAMGRAERPAAASVAYRRRRGVAGWFGLGRPRRPPRHLT